MRAAVGKQLQASLKKGKVFERQIRKSRDGNLSHIGWRRDSVWDFDLTGKDLVQVMIDVLLVRPLLVLDYSFNVQCKLVRECVLWWAKAQVSSVSFSLC